jgi:uncharacterized protein with ParB-like and HNH nuclease domain
MDSRLPSAYYKTNTLKLYDIDFLMHNKDKSDKSLFGFNIPDFQRGLVWSNAQKIRLIESLFLEIPIGTYMINDISQTHDIDNPLNNLLLDGQQRLNAIYCYLNSDFRVFGYFWHELNLKEQGKLLRSPFHCVSVHESDLFKLESIYNLLNFGGTSHDYSKEQVLRIVAKFANSYNTEKFLDGTDSLEYAINEVKDLIDWNV